MTAAADLIRATVHNRVDNQVRGASVANHRHRRSDRSRGVFARCRVSRRDQSLRPSHTVVTSQTVRRLTGRALGRRPVRGVTSEEGKSGPKALRAPSPRIRHRATGQLVTDTIPSCRSEHPRRRRPCQHHRRKTRFSTPTNREPIRGPPGEPTLRNMSKTR